MNKIWAFIKKHFITWKFLTFAFIGVINTVIDNALYYQLFWHTSIGIFFSKAISVIAATIFSYFANMIFTFKPKNRTATQFSAVMLTLGLRWVLSAGLTLGLDHIFTDWFNVNYDTYKFLSIIPSFVASAVFIPIFYFALDWVFKKTDKEKAKNNL